MTNPATNSASLTTRAESNRRFGGADFEVWVQELLASIDFTRVLDLCCGTGNQLVLYAARPGIEQLVGVDASTSALARAEERLGEMSSANWAVLECVGMDDAFACPSIQHARFDLASCFYGLYYAADPVAVLDAMIDRLDEHGTVLIVGPWGENNATLFNLLERHFSLPENVLSSARTFMSETVLPTIARRLQLETRRFVNPVRYPDAAAVLDYWRASTFFDPAFEAAVTRDVEAHVAVHGEFVLEKHVMAAIGRKATTL